MAVSSNGSLQTHASASDFEDTSLTDIPSRVSGDSNEQSWCASKGSPSHSSMPPSSRDLPLSSKDPRPSSRDLPLSSTRPSSRDLRDLPLSSKDPRPLSRDLPLSSKDSPLSSRDLRDLPLLSKDPHPSSSDPPPPLSRIGLNDHKAGMKGLDKDRINEIIVEASKGSKFYQNELRKDQEIKKRVEHVLHRLSQVTATQRAEALHTANKEAMRMECGRDLSHVIVHVDMDAFYAAVEIRDNPGWREIPVAVGSKSMLSTSNYVARRYGVRAAMPGFIALKLCPDLLIVSPNFHKYQQVSEEVKEVLACYDPNFCPMGLDESYLELTESVKGRLQEEDLWTKTDIDSASSSDMDQDYQASLWAVAEQVVEELRGSIHQKTGLTASAGIAPNKMLAKIASDMNKPNGQYLVEPTKDGILRFMHSLPIRKVCGIGKVTEKMLNALGVTVCHDLYEKRATLRLACSSSSANFFLSISLGLGSVQVQRTNDRKGISTERSFSEISDPKLLKEKCLELCKILSKDMLEENIRGYTVTLKLKTVDFAVKSRAVTLTQPISKWEDLYDSVRGLLEEEMRSCQPHLLRLRLMGVRVTSLTSKRPRNLQQSLVSFLKTTRNQSTSANTTCNTHSNGESSNDLDVTVTASERDILDSSCDPSSNHQDNVEEFVCPVCTKSMNTDNAGLNQHIDQCLNRSAVREAVQEYRDGTEGTLRKKANQSSYDTCMKNLC